VKIENPMSFAEALNKANVPFEFHVYQKGGHGLGLGTRDGDPAKLHPWTAACATWLRLHGFVK
jgi:acetyl esterase/lipase